MNEMSLRWQEDPVIIAMTRMNLTHKIVLEIGCGDGWRVSRIAENISCDGHGIDPSSEAIDGSKYKNISLHEGYADDLPYSDCSLDVVIFGFCLYWCARDSYFQIAKEADRVLAYGGSLIIYDFYPDVPQYNLLPDGGKSFKMDFSKMFSWHPNYKIVYKDICKEICGSDDNCSVIILQKKGE